MYPSIAKRLPRSGAGSCLFFHLQPCCGLAIRVYTCVTLCCTCRLVPRRIVSRVIQNHGQFRPFIPCSGWSCVCSSSSQHAYGATSVSQLQWSSQLRFPSVVRLYELFCCAIKLTAVASGGVQSGTGHPTESCGVIFVKVPAELESQPEPVAEGPGKFIRSPQDGWPLHTQ